MGIRNALLVVVAACSYAAPPDVLPPLFAAVHPSIASAGDTIMLEGSFSETTTVQFPGGDVRMATLHGPHRASVTVPAGATEGDLFVTTANTKVGPVAFRRAGFGPSLGEFRQTVSLMQARREFATAVVKNNVYLIGGYSGSGVLDTIEHATIGADGALGSFTMLQIKLPAPRRHDTAVVLGDWLYVLNGGQDGPELSVVRARILSDGTLEAFQAAGSLLQAHSGNSAVVIGNLLYVLGGDALEAAEIDGDTLMPFHVVDTTSVPADGPNPISRTDAQTSVIGDSLCLIGGYDAGVMPSTTAVCAPIGSDGSLGELHRTASEVMPRADSANLVVGTRLYMLGGTTSSSPLLSVVRVPLDPASSFEEFAEGAMGVARQGAAAILVGDSVCVIGGGNHDASFLDSVECAGFAPAQ